MKKDETIESHWHHYFDDLQLSPKELYASIEVDIHARQYPSVRCGRAYFNQGGMLSQRAEYLCIERDSYRFYIYAAQFGKSFIISYWLRKTPRVLASLLARIPIFGYLFVSPASFYEIDAELLFKDSIQSVVKKLVEEIASTKGYRSDEHIAQLALNMYVAPPKKFFRNTFQNLIGGLCAGVADYTGMDIAVARLIALIIAVLIPIPAIILYLILWVATHSNAFTNTDMAEQLNAKPIDTQQSA